MTLASFKGACADKIRSLKLLEKAESRQGCEALLEHTLSSMLCSAAPKLLLWGDELLAFYNDSFKSLDAAAGLSALGENYAALRPEVWRILKPYVSRALSGEERVEADLRIFGDTADEGSRRHFCRCYFAPVVNEGGAVCGVLIDIQDSTDDRQLSERLLVENRRMQNLFREAPVMIAYVSSDDFKLQFANPAFQNFYGRRSLEGRTVAEAIPEAEEQGFGKLLRDVIDSGESFVGNDVPLTVREGSRKKLKYTDFVYHPVKGENGQIAGVLCTATDVTEKVQARIDRENLRHQILHASRVNAMGTVAMTLAHELNQPLSAATNYLNAAHRFLAEGEARSSTDSLDAIDHARDQVIRAGDIIRRMRPLIRSGEAERQTVSVSSAVDRAVNLLVAGDGFCLKVTQEISPEASEVLADPIQLEQVLINLLRNANEASKDAHRKEVVVATEPSGEDCVSVSLRDFGHGLAADKIEELSGLNSKIGKEGLGVGLALSRTLIEANGGNLRAKNAPDDEEGAIFTFELERA